MTDDIRNPARMTPATSVMLPNDDADAPNCVALVVREAGPGRLLLTLPGNRLIERQASTLTIVEDCP